MYIMYFAAGSLYNMCTVFKVSKSAFLNEIKLSRNALLMHVNHVRYMLKQTCIHLKTWLRAWLSRLMFFGTQKGERYTKVKM